MSGKPCIHCGAHVNYFSGSNCDVGHLHRACWKAFHSTPKPETESPKHQQRPDEESGWTDAHDKESSNRGTSVSTHSDGGDATNIDEQTEPAFENTEAVAELLQAAVSGNEDSDESNQQSEKTTAQKVGKGCGIISIVLIIAVVLGAFILLNSIGSGLKSFQDNIGCRVSSGNCK